VKKLGLLVLPEQTRWVDRFSWAPVKQTSKRTLGGAYTIWTQTLKAGRPITLEFRQDESWLTHSEMSSLTDMANRAGETYSLVWDTETWLVIFRHEDAPVCALQEVEQYIEPSENHFYGQIKLVQIN